jgi:hypothetical protein
MRRSATCCTNTRGHRSEGGAAGERPTIPCAEYATEAASQRAPLTRARRSITAARPCKQI